MKKLKTLVMSIPVVLGFSSCNSEGNSPAGSDSTAVRIDLSQVKYIGSVDERYQSYNVEMVEVAGGEVWKPYHLMDSLPGLAATSTYYVSQKNVALYRKLSPIDLTNKRLLNLAKWFILWQLFNEF